MSAWRRRYDALDCARPSPTRVAELRAALLLALVDEHGPEVAEVARRFIDGELVEVPRVDDPEESRFWG